jgi:hypothetical protein
MLKASIQHYKDKSSDPKKAQSYVVCVNSLGHLSHLTEYEKNDYVVFIDELTSFLNLTHNDTLNHNIKYVYSLLTSLIKRADKVIVSDAIIFDNAFEFLKTRMQTHKKTLYIKNEFNKFQDVPAVRVKDENLMLDKILNECKNNKPFLFGCDSATIATEWMNKCKSEVSEKDHDKFILLTADTNIKITDAEKQFKNKYVFYSPKITYGVDFSIDTPQNVYIYQKGQSIMPNGTFQQTTRCRNIESLYYYSEVKEHEAHYTSLEDVKQTLTENVKYFQTSNQQLYNVSSIYDEDEEKFKVIENSFFNLFCFTEYVNDSYQTNMTQHFENLLILNGFDISEEGTAKKMDNEDKKEIKELTKQLQDELFEEFINTECKGHKKYDAFNTNINFLKIPQTKEMLEKYKAEITDKHVLQDHLNIIRLLKTDKYIYDKQTAAKNSCYDVKNMTTIYSQI